MSEVNITFDFRYALVVLTAVVIAAVVLVIIRNRQRQQIKAEMDLLNQIIETVYVEKSLKDNLIRLLHIYSRVVKDATSYGLYRLDEKTGTYVLKSVIQSLKEEENIEPSYSGLLPYNKEVFFMPSNLSVNNIVEKICIRNEGKVPLIHVPLAGIQTIVVIGPKSKLKKKTQKILETIGPSIEHMGRIMFWNEEQGSRAVVAVSSDRALKNISRIFTDYQRMLERITSLTAKSIRAEAGFFVNRNGEQFRIESNFNLKDDVYAALQEDTESQKALYEMLGSSKSFLITQEKPQFYRLPQVLAADGMEAAILIEVDTIKGNGIAVFIYKHEPALEEYQITALHVLSEQMSELMDNQLRFKELSYSYTDMLRMLAQLIDNINPATVGYSEQMAGYAVAIGKELNLDPERIRAIALAAYFSNIGIIGLSDDILSEKGKYTEIQYEMMKLHAEVGASIIESTLGDEEIASYIRYHHEREDGYGYPEGLRGAEVPIGARIIGVLQTFLAKLQSREYRDALPFDDALKQLAETGGTQHDAEVIEALIGWFARKRAENIDSGTTLGRCWEMRRCPETICTDCPAYRNTEIHCWKHEENNCSAHGNQCTTCFVYTEYAQRTMLK